MNLPRARRSGIVVQSLENETLVYDLVNNKALCLNETSLLVWKNCDGEKNVQDIADILTEKLKTLVSADLVYLALEQLKTNDLVKGEIENGFAGLSRREAIRKIGFGSAVALPLITSIVSPTAVMGQSCTQPGTVTPFPPGIGDPTIFGDFTGCANFCNPVADTLCCSGNGTTGTINAFPCECLDYICS